MTNPITPVTGTHPTRVITAFLWVGLFLAMISSVHAQAQSSTAGSGSASNHKAVLDRYCVTCHNERMQTGNLALDTLNINRVGDHAELWEKVLRKLQTQSMPPPRRPRPDTSTYDEFAAWLVAELDHASTINLNPGRPTIHRLNRLEYGNAIRDLLALEVDTDTFLPSDDMAYGFDNNADILTVVPGLLARYMSAARKLSRLAIGDPSIDADIVHYPISSLLVQDDQMNDDLPFGSRGGTTIRHYFPLDGEYVVSIKLQSGVRGQQGIDVRLDGMRVGLLSVGQRKVPTLRGQPAIADGLTVRFPARAGSHVIGVSFVKRARTTEGIGPSHLPLWTFSTGPGFARHAALQSVQIEGPFNPNGPGDTPSRRRIFICRPAGTQDEESCTGKILATLARRAFRRPVTDDDLQVLQDFYTEGRRRGSFDAGIQRALESILVDPEFLYRFERDPADVAPATAYRLSDVELASRLSFFLWASIPDGELLDVAAEGRLSNQAVLEQQVRRMLADERSSALVTSFAGQWLHLRRMDSVTPDVNAFPTFDENLREAFVRETELFLGSQLKKDQSVIDLLTADYTFVNERLARHYGMPDIFGSRFRRVAQHDDARRGLLGHGSILTVTSLATRTSPVVRGKWLLENILGTPPPPPPPNVPELGDQPDSGQVTSLRERLEAHRVNPICANCHSRMDPIGFAFENFDAVGRWRETDNNVPIDSSGVLPDGTAFAGVSELRDVLLSRRNEFVTTVTQKLLTYALGRGTEYYDQPAIRTIVREAARDDHRWSAIILGVVRSIPFQMRKSES